MIAAKTKRKRRVKSHKTKLMEKADSLVSQINQAEHSRCFVCGGPNEAGHHFHAKGGCAVLRYSMGNVIPLCRPCHFKHHAGDATIHSYIVRMKGQKWEASLEVEIRLVAELIRAGFIQKRNVAYYEGVIESLEARLTGD